MGKGRGKHKVEVVIGHPLSGRQEARVCPWVQIFASCKALSNLDYIEEMDEK